MELSKSRQNQNNNGGQNQLHHISSASNLTKGIISRKQTLEGTINVKEKMNQTKKPRGSSCSPQLKTSFNDVNCFNFDRKNPYTNNIFQNNQCEMKTIFEKKQKNQIQQTPPRNNKTGKKDKQKKQNKLKLTQLKDLKPMNLEQEKQIFFQKQHIYDPVFFYQMNNIEFTIQKPHTKYLDLAIKILDSVNQTYGCDTNYYELDGGSIITQEETQNFFKRYIEDLEIQELISFEFSENTVAPTSCIHNNSEGSSKVIIGLPIVYRKNNIIGVLNHEIGTHFLRKYNDKFQKWHPKLRKKFDMQNYSKIEEGLATINQHFEKALDNQKFPFLYKAALHYYSSFLSSHMSFSELFISLQKYITTPDERWKACVRVKRGISDTKTKQGYYKDQIYLTGAIKVLRNRHNLNYINLHAGKITVKDCIKLTDKNQIYNKEQLKIPYFLKNIDIYKKALDRIAKINFID